MIAAAYKEAEDDIQISEMRIHIPGNCSGLDVEASCKMDLVTCIPLVRKTVRAKQQDGIDDKSYLAQRYDCHLADNHPHVVQVEAHCEQANDCPIKSPHARPL